MARLNEVLNYVSKYDENGVLKNNLGIRDNETLNKYERMITNYKLANLYLKPINQEFDVDHYLNIHKYLFEDIYQFAGQIRSENIKKTFPFCVPELIYINLKRTLEEANGKISKINSEEDLINFLSYLYSELNVIHPFREGNGRVEREFLRQYLEKINQNIDFGVYSLEYDMIDNKDNFIKAVIIAGVTCDLTYLKEFMAKILVKKEQLKK